MWSAPNTVDGTIAHRELRSTKEPYDPQLQRQFGTATVKSLQPLKNDKADAENGADVAAPAH